VDTVSRPVRRLSAARNERYVEELTWQARGVRVAKRLVSTTSPRLRQPNTYSAVLMAGLIVAIVAQTPLAKMIGTAPQHAVVTSAAAPVTAPAQATTPAVAPVSGSGHVKTHAPRDPFRPLIASDGSVLAPQVIHAGGRHAVTTVHHHAGSGSASGGSSQCQPIHTVVAGESLWTIAEQEVGDSGRSVDATWRALLAANATTLGANPSLLVVGEKLCLPSPLKATKVAKGADVAAQADVVAPAIVSPAPAAKITTTPVARHSASHPTRPAAATTRRMGRFGYAAPPGHQVANLVGSSYDATESASAARRSARSGRRDRGLDHHLRRSGGLLPA
jgi:nucleoid-associated protein YgaU